MEDFFSALGLSLSLFLRQVVGGRHARRLLELLLEVAAVAEAAVVGNGLIAPSRLLPVRVFARTRA